MLFELYINNKNCIIWVYLFREGHLFRGEAFIWENTIYFFISVIYCSTKIHQNTLPKFTDFFYRKLLAFLPKNCVTLPIFTLPKFTVTELNFVPFTAHYRYRFFRKIIYRPIPTHELTFTQSTF